MGIIKKSSLVLLGAVLGAASWQVGSAAVPLDTVVVCSRPGADLRAPTTSGTCPSGYTKTEISDGAPAANPAYFDSGPVLPFAGVSGVLAASVQVPAGSYAVHADGQLLADTGTAQTFCQVFDADGAVAPGGVQTHLDRTIEPFATAAMSSVVTTRAGEISVRCALLAATDAATTKTFWNLTVVQVSSAADQS